MKYKFLLFSILYPSMSLSGELVLHNDRIGNLKLNEDILVSPDKIKELFPNKSISHDIGQGDSPDFHYITISTKPGEELFTIYSFFDDDVNEKTREYDIDLLVTSNEKVMTESGVSVGDKISKLVSAKGKEFNLIANHHDNSIGKDRIYYQFDMPPNVKIENVGMVYLDPTKVTLDKVFKEDPVIKAISWPSARWD